MSEEDKILVYKWLEDGKFVEVWNEVDFMKLYWQIGAIAPNE